MGERGERGARERGVGRERGGREREREREREVGRERERWGRDGGARESGGK